MRRRKITRPLILAAITIMPPTGAAHAQTANDHRTAVENENAGLAEIVVTAQKRAENLQDVPIAVTAFSGDTLADRGVTDAQALARLVPNMAFSNNYGQVRITLRGLSFQDLATQGGEARVAYHIDGAYVGMTGDIGGTFFDIGRVEVNRGPQGTLFGRNAIAGTVNVVTRDPTEVLSGYLNAEVGNYSTHNLDGAISGPLADGVSARIAFQTRNHSGYEFNVPNSIDINNQNTQAFRGKLKFDRGGSFSAVLSADYFHESDREGTLNVGFAREGVVPPAVMLGAIVSDGNPRHHFGGTLPFTGKTTYGLALDAKLDLGNNFSLASLTSYRHSDFEYRYNSNDSLPLIDSVGTELAKQYSQELRLEKSIERGNIVVGGFLYGQNYDMTSINPALGTAGAFIGLPPGAYLEDGYAQGFTLGGGVKTRAVAGFGQLTYELTDTTTLIAGARYSWERKRKHDTYFNFNLRDPFDPNYVYMGPVVNDEVKYTDFSPRVTLQQKIGSDQLIYITFAKGFKAGGFNLSAATEPAYLPEKLTSYEAGFKFELFDRKVRFNGAGFYYDYKDLQVVVAQIVGNRNVNAATAKIYGAEFELTAAPVPGLELDAAAAILKSEFTQFDTFIPFEPASGQVSLAGNRLPFTPKYTMSYGAQYTLETGIGPFTIRGDGQTKSQVFFDQFNRQNNSEDAFTILNASIGWKDANERFSVTAYVKNITDKLALNGTFMNGGLQGFGMNGRYDPPRTYGFRFGVKF